jgi:hypothetical protein
MNSRKFAYLSILLGLVTFIGAAALYLARTTPLSAGSSIDTTVFESYGSFLGGVVGPFFALAGVLLLITTISEQKDALIKQQIEGRFFQLIAIARDNSRQIRVAKRSGRRVYLTLLRELYESYEVAREVCAEYRVSNDDVANIAYLAFYYGAVGSTSSAVLRERLEGKYPRDFLGALERAYESRGVSQLTQFPYRLFAGHQSRLGHYFRHLFQAVKYINEQPTNVLTYEEKYQYVKTLRAQLSTQEQVLFLWNSLSELGSAWERNPALTDPNDHLVTKYNLVKNIPAGYSRHVEPRKYYPLVSYEGLKKDPDERAALKKSYH